MWCRRPNMRPPIGRMVANGMRERRYGRIVNVSSSAHYSGRLDLDNINGGGMGIGGLGAYGKSKLALVLFTYELARRLKGTGVTANCLHPGAVATNIWSRPLGRAGFIMKLPRLFMMGPEGGAKTPIYLASSPDVEGVSGKYFTNKKEKESSKESNDEQVARRLWMVSEDLTGLPE